MVFYKVSRIFYRIFGDFLWDFLRFDVLCFCRVFYVISGNFYGLSMVFYGMFKDFLWDFLGFTMGVL